MLCCVEQPRLLKRMPRRLLGTVLHAMFVSCNLLASVPDLFPQLSLPPIQSICKHLMSKAGISQAPSYGRNGDNHQFAPPAQFSQPGSRGGFQQSGPPINQREGRPPPPGATSGSLEPGSDEHIQMLPPPLRDEVMVSMFACGLHLHAYVVLLFMLVTACLIYDSGRWAVLTAHSHQHETSSFLGFDYKIVAEHGLFVTEVCRLLRGVLH